MKTAAFQQSAVRQVCTGFPMRSLQSNAAGADMSKIYILIVTTGGVVLWFGQMKARRVAQGSPV